MTDRGVSDYDMPNRTWPPRTDVSGIPDTALSALLAGAPPSAADAPVSLQHVAEVLAALRAEPAPDEMTGRAAALAEFRLRVSGSARAARSRRVRPAVLMPLVRTRARAAGTAAVLSFAGIIAAAYAGALPAAAQTVAHATIGAPRPAQHQDSPAADHSGTPVGPNASGHPRFGLCTAFSHAKKLGSEAEKSIAFRNLARAAGGAANVASYCAAAAHPGSPQSGARQPSDESNSGDKPHTTGKPPHP